MSRPHYAGDIWKRSFISTVGHTFYTNPSRKRSFSTTLFNPNEFENASFFVLVWMENILKTELSISENDDVTIIMWFPCLSFPQTQNQNGR